MYPLPLPIVEEKFQAPWNRVIRTFDTSGNCIGQLGAGTLHTFKGIIYTENNLVLAQTEMNGLTPLCILYSDYFALKYPPHLNGASKPTNGNLY